MALSIKTSSGSAENVKTDVLVLPVSSLQDLERVLPKNIAKALQPIVKKLQFTGASGTAELFLTPNNVVDATFIALVGIGTGKPSSLDAAEGLRRGIGKVMQDARRHMLLTMAIRASHIESEEGLIEAAVEAIYLANYRFVEYAKALAKDQAARALQSVTFLISSPSQKDVSVRMKRTEAIMDGVKKTRDLVNQPASHVSPFRLVKEARRIASSTKHVSLKVLDKKVAAKQNFHAFLAVAKGSSEEPYVIHLTYKPPKAKKKIMLIGKGITFDSGGLSLKPANSMTDMKIDMAGAATVLGLFSVLPTLNINCEVHGIIATCENMPSGEAYRPGDVLTAKNGKTIEVLNTDAEGRLTLADALSYATEYKPDILIDIATLTGAVMVAVGETHAGLWSNNDALQESLLEAGKKAGEGLVAFPLPQEYKPAIASKIADLANIGSTRYGDAILAALFLQEFVGETTWAHIDLAGPVFGTHSSLPYLGYGATGYGVRTLAHFLQHQ